MGGETSKEIRVPLDGASLAGGAALRARDEAESAEAARLRKLEESLFKAGYAHGRDDALASLDEEIRRQAGRAYASLALEDETARAAALDAALQRLEATGPRRASARAASECQAEEAAFLACTPSAAEDCAAPVRAYVRCADDVLFRMMNLGGKAAAAATAAAAPAAAQDMK